MVGAGDVAAQLDEGRVYVYFGSGSGLAPAVFGGVCLALGLFLGEQALSLLAELKGKVNGTS